MPLRHNRETGANPVQSRCCNRESFFIKSLSILGKAKKDVELESEELPVFVTVICDRQIGNTVR